MNTLGRLSDVEQFEDIIVKAQPASTEAGETLASTSSKVTAAIVRVKDIARVELSQQQYTIFSGLSGKKAANIAVFALPGANALQVAAETRKLMVEMSKAFPLGLQYTTLYDTTVFIDQSVHAVYETLIEAGILVLIVIMLFLQNFRAMLVPATTVPVTIVGAFAAMALLGFTINLMTLFALILAIGIVVDDAIVIVENTSRYIEEGLTPKDAAIKAMSELTGPVLGITLVLTAVFLPASFLPGITGQMFRQFALVIAATAIISAINALTLKPTQCALYLRPAVKDRQVNWFYRGFNRAYGEVEGRYIGLVQWMVDRPGKMACLFFIVAGGAAVMFARYPTAFLPTEDQGYCVLVAQLPAGASQLRVRQVSADVDALLKNVPGIKGWVTSGGFSDPDAANLSNVVTKYVMYDDWDKRPADLSQNKIVADLRQRLQSIRKAQFNVLIPPPVPGLGQAGGFQMMIEDRAGIGLAQLEKAIRQIILAVDKEPGLHDVTTTFNPRSPQIHLTINRTMAESLGVTIDGIFQT
ncbi:MAG: efflux RND transporter permease subunit, partial [Pseudolabrys sp.]